MKFKNTILFLLGLISFVIQSCGNSHNVFEDFDFSTSQYVNLCEYRDIEIDNEMLIITEEDIETIVNLDFSNNEIYKKIQNRTVIYDGDIISIELTSVKNNYNKEEIYYVVGSEDFSKEFDMSIIGTHVSEKKEVKLDGSKYNMLITGIYEPANYNDKEMVLSFYGFTNIEEVKEYVIKKARKNIIYNYKMDKILNDSTIDTYPSIIEYYVSIEMEKLRLKTKEEKTDTEKYVKVNYGMSIEEVEQQFYNYYFELMIAKAVLEEENISISEKEFNQKIRKFSEENDLSVKGALEEYGVEVYYSYLTEDLLKPYLTE